MIGSIIGDICGSSYEYRDFNVDNIDLLNKDSKFTDDTILTVAIAEAFMYKKKDLVSTVKEYSLRFPDCGFGSKYKEWLFSDSSEPYNSFGNGSAMRVSSIPYLYSSFDLILEKTKESSEITHNHPDGMLGALAISFCIHLALKGFSKEEIRREVIKNFNYSLEDYIITEKFNCLASITVPNAILCFLNSSSFEETILNSIKLKGDTDTIACMAGGIAEAYYGLDSIPSKYIDKVKELLPEDFIHIIKSVYLYNGIEVFK